MILSFSRRLLRLASILALPLTVIAACSQEPVGPYLVHAIPGGPEVRHALPAETITSDRWSEWVWFRVTPGIATSPSAALATTAVSTPDPDASLTLYEGRPRFELAGIAVTAATAVTSSGWHLAAATISDRSVQLYVDGIPAGKGTLPKKEEHFSNIQLAPASAPGRFNGWLALSVVGRTLSDADVAALWASHPPLDDALFEENAKPWPLQTRQQVGYRAPQPPDEMPHGAPAQAPHSKPEPPATPALRADGERQWQLAGGWRLFSNDGATPALTPDDGSRISEPAFNDNAWYAATVPGTVLTTLIDRGVYPDPDYGLNNLAIPESLNKHDYWYRIRFDAPPHQQGRHMALHFGGINYEADVWLNGKPLGSIRGAFRRGDYDVTKTLLTKGNVLAVRIAPPPHPGIPQEQSIKGGPGENGGAMVVDGPTFVATEGWDWIPAIRDRNIGLWQGVTLTESGSVTLGDAQVITRLPLPQNTSADVELHIPLQNHGSTATTVAVSAEFEGVHLSRTAIVPPGGTTLDLTPKQFPQLHLDHPRLWWPNGYGSPELYHLKLTVQDAAHRVSDQHTSTFGVREISYELSLFDKAGALQRVEAIPTETLGRGFDPVDVTHEGMRQTSTPDGWASTITPAAEGTSAILPISNPAGMTDLVIRVNGVRIAARGGNWGMDDSRKRVSREHLEPYFRLHREANLNIIRNWVGQDTEETFFQLADEYGMMVWNDFWESTQDYNAEPGDIGLFMDNARDTVRRYRNHPSIILWCGRNEGVPPPALNRALITMLREEDGTRFYSPSSNRVNLRNSGPYRWQSPDLYFSKLNRGFSVELGIASFPTLESFESTTAPADRWPISDAWAYHDWHAKGNGETGELMRHVETQLGPSASLVDFERRMQLFNYVDHQAIFEGMYQHLWTPNSGRMIWMTHPAWPSTMWQMYTSDYDTQASFYAIRKANAPVHIQMDLSDYSVAGVNTTQSLVDGATVKAGVYSIDGQKLNEVQQAVRLLPNATLPLFQLPLQQLLKNTPLVFVRLEMNDASGKRIADNFYWIASEEKNFRGLNGLKPVALTAKLQDAATQTTSGERTYTVDLSNPTKTPAIAISVRLQHTDGSRILPAYYDDNYISLLPGEKRTIRIQIPNDALHGDTPRLTVGGWNIDGRMLP